MKVIYKTVALAALSAAPLLGNAQAAVDLYNLSRPDMRGTARFMSMGGAFTALGGDLSSLNQNPAGIGIYRSSEVGLTLNLDFQSSKTDAQGLSTSDDQTKFTFNNFGYIGTIRLNSESCPTFSWGASYARVQSFDRVFRGGIRNLGGASLSNYVAAMTNSEGWTPQEMFPDNRPNSWNPYRDTQAPWLSLLAYQGYAINDQYNSNDEFEGFQGLMGDNTGGSASFQVREKGYVDEYSINFGGNVYNTVYWGIGFGITDINYTQQTFYEENLSDAYIAAESRTEQGNFGMARGTADYRLSNYLNSNGTGFNVKFGVIVKPVNELRIGFAVHTPTWYQITDTYWGAIGYDYRPGRGMAPDGSMVDYANEYLDNSGIAETNNGVSDYTNYNMRTPWRMMVGIAGVIGGQGILSMDYEYRGTNMQASSSDGYTYEDVKADVKQYFKGTNILRLGAEYRVTRQFSLRLGYSYEWSGVKQQAANDGLNIWTAGTLPSYTFDNNTQYITAGLGYRVGGFYADLAYVNRHRESTWHAFSPIVVQETIDQGSPAAKVSGNRNQVVLSLGYKF